LFLVELHLQEAAKFLLLAGCAGVGDMVPSQFGCKFASGTVFGGAFGCFTAPKSLFIMATRLKENVFEFW